MNSKTLKLPIVALPHVNKRVAILFLVGVSLWISILFRVFALDRIPGVNGDEAVVAVTIHEANIGKPVVLRMPTGRMFSPVYAGFSFVMDQVLPRSFFVLRLPALIAGLFLILLTFLFVKKHFGIKAAVFATLLVAVSPTNIAYSRSGVEQSFTGLFGVALAFAAMESAWILLAILFVLAFLMHPTNVFVVPLLAVLVGFRYRENKRAVLCSVLFSLLIVGLLSQLVPSHFLELVSYRQVVARFFSFNSIKTFLFHWLGLISGTSAIEQFVGYIPQSFKQLWNSIVGIGIVFLLVLKIRSFNAFIIGSFLISFVFYAISGNFGMEPGVLRYALVLLNPILISLGILLSKINRNEKKLIPVFSFIILVSLFQTGLFFFGSITKSNSTAHPTYKTGNQEPKEVAVQRILSNRRGNHTKVLVEDWWTYWPIRYLALSHPDLEVLLFQQGMPPQIIGEILKGGGIVVSPAGGNFEKWIGSQGSNLPVLTSNVEGYGNEQVLRLWASR